MYYMSDVILGYKYSRKQVNITSALMGLTLDYTIVGEGAGGDR